MEDAYRLLGVSRQADEAGIKAAYRRLAKELYPDRNPGDAEAERRFKAVTAAYYVLSDPARRRRYDRGEIDLDGNPRARRFRSQGAGAGGRFGSFNVEDIFSELFGGKNPFARAGNGAETGRRAAPPREDGRERLEIDLLTAVRGGRERFTLPSGRTLELTVPAGAEDGQVLRLRGQGRSGGDLLVELRLRPHPRFTRKGADIHLELPISLCEAVQGARVEVPTVDGPVRLAVPPGANTGGMLRLKGRGVPRPDGSRGDQYVRLSVVLPDPPDPELDAFLKRWAARHPYDVRSRLDPV
jgi:DnaJ-class molecular chaperone